MIQNRTHAFGDGLVLQMDALDSAVDDVVMLSGPVHAPVIACIRCKPPAAEPVGGVGEKIVAPSHAADWRAVLETRRLLGHGRCAARPPQHTVHGVLIVERQPSADLHVLPNFAIRHLRPEREDEVAEAPGDPAGTGRAITPRRSCPKRYRRCDIPARGSRPYDGLD